MTVYAWPVAVAAAAAAITAICIPYVKTYKLRSRRTELLFEISMKVCRAHKKSELLKLIRDSLPSAIGTERVYVYLIDPRTEELYIDMEPAIGRGPGHQLRLPAGQGIAGATALEGEALLLNDPDHDPRISSDPLLQTGISINNLLSIPITNRGQVIGVLQAVNKHRHRSFTPGDQQLLEQLAVPIAVSLENVQLYEAFEHSIEALKTTKADNDKMESELRIAGDIQQGLLPRNNVLMKLEDFQVFASLRPAREVGGDFVNYYLLDDNHLFFTLGDVSDKGMPAALFMAAVLTLIKGTTSLDLGPSELLDRVNTMLCQDDPAMFATIVCGILELSTGHVRLSDGGHCTPFLLKSDGEVEPLKLRKGLPLGAMAEAVYHDGEYLLSPGESLLLYTDGIIEAENEEGQLFGTGRLKRFLHEHQGAEPLELTSKLLDYVHAFAGEASQFDDIACFSLMRR